MHHPFSPRLLIIAIAFACAGLAVPIPGLADDTVTNTVTQRYDIPASPLDATLTAIARQSGKIISFDPNLVQGHGAPAVQGDLSFEQAVQQALSGSDLELITTSNGTLTVQRVPVGSEQQLSEVKVTANPEASTNGYVATQSTTGTKTNTPIIETPQSISVVTRQQMDDQQPQNLPQALAYTAGVAPVSGTNNNSNNAGYLLLRGFQPLVYLDGLTTFTGEATDGGLNFADPYLLGRIDVLSGPSSVLYGQTNPGGLINMESKLPTATPFHEVLGGIGNYDRYEAAFDIGGPLDQDGKFLYRLTGIGSDQHSQMDFTKQEDIAIAPAFTYKPDDNTTFTVLAKYIDQPELGAYYTGFYPAQGTVLPNPNGKISTSLFTGDPNYNSGSRQIASLGYLFEHRFSDVWTFRQNVNYVNEMQTAYAIRPVSLGNNLQTESRLQLYQQNTDNFLDFDNQAEARFSTGPIQHTVLLGVDYQHFTNTNPNGDNRSGVPSLNLFAPVYNLPPVTALNPTTVDHLVMDQIAPYIQDQLAIGHWRLLVGVRDDWATLNSSSNAIGSSTFTSPSSSDELTPSYHAGGVYLFDNGLAPYASYTTSFQPNTGFSFTNTAFSPTTAKQYEGGIKYQPPGWNSFITAAAYNLVEQNVLTADPNNPGFDIQTGEITVNGREFSAHASLTNNLSVIATYTVTDAVVSKDAGDTGTTLSGVTESIQGKVPAQIPDKMASLWADYTLPVSPLRGLGFGGGVRYIGQSYGDNVNSFAVPQYTLYDAVLHWDLGLTDSKLKGLKLQINANNLFDKTYVASCASSLVCYYGLRRTILATLKYDW